MLDQAHVVVAVATVITVLAAVILHYECFLRISEMLKRGQKQGRQRILWMVFALISSTRCRDMAICRGSLAIDTF